MVNSATLSNLEKVKESQINLIFLPKVADLTKLINIIDFLTTNYKKLCYVTFRTPYIALAKELKKAGKDLDKFIFIDMITSGKQDQKNCIFIGSPGDLTRLSIEFSNILKYCDVILVDSLSAMEIYSSANTILRFIHDIITKARISEKKIIFLVFKDHSTFVNDSIIFMDSTSEF